MLSFFTILINYRNHLTRTGFLWTLRTIITGTYTENIYVFSTKMRRSVPKLQRPSVALPRILVWLKFAHIRWFYYAEINAPSVCFLCVFARMLFSWCNTSRTHNGFAPFSDDSANTRSSIPGVVFNGLRTVPSVDIRSVGQDIAFIQISEQVGKRALMSVFKCGIM